MYKNPVATLFQAQSLECWLLRARRRNKPESSNSPSVGLGFSRSGFCNSSWAPERRLHGCGPRAWLFRGARDLPGPGIKPVFPVLAGWALYHWATRGDPRAFLWKVTPLPLPEQCLLVHFSSAFPGLGQYYKFCQSGRIKNKQAKLPIMFEWGSHLILCLFK